MLVSPQAVPIGGDELAVNVCVGRGARLVVGSATAAVARRGPAGSPSLQRVRIRIDAGGVLIWAPEPTIGADGCRHRQEVTITVEDGGDLLWYDELVRGREGEEGGELVADLRLVVGERTLLATAHTFGGPTWTRSPSVAGHARALATLLAVGKPAHALGEWTDPATEAFVVVAPLSPDALVVQALGPSLAAVRAAIARIAPRDSSLMPRWEAPRTASTSEPASHGAARRPRSRNCEKGGSDDG